jgi:hypothetical protein
VTLSIEKVSIEKVSIEGSWAAVCPVGDVPVGAGVAALLDDNVQVAIFRLPSGQFYALSNMDLFSGAADWRAGSSVTAAALPWSRRRSTSSVSTSVPERAWMTTK